MALPPYYDFSKCTGPSQTPDFRVKLAHIFGNTNQFPYAFDKMEEPYFSVGVNIASCSCWPLASENVKSGHRVEYLSYLDACCFFSLK